MSSREPETTEEWLMLCARHEASARMLADHKLAAAEGHWHAGLATECALKAYIMHSERFNAWPSRASRPDLYIHDVRKLMRLAGIAIARGDPTAPSWHVVLQWDRNQGYDPKPMPRKVAKAMVEATFGKEGVVTWLRSKLA